MARYQLTSPEGQRYEIEAPDDAPQEQVLEYFAKQTGQKPNVGTGEATLRNLNDTLSFGFYDPAVAHVKTLASQATGSKDPYWDEYRSTLARERARTGAAHSQIGPRIVGETAGMVAQGLATLPAAPAVNAYRAAEPVISAGKALFDTARQAVPYGVAYGTAQGLGHTTGGSIAEQGQGMLEGAIGGGLTAPVFAGGLFGVGQGLNALMLRREASRDAAWQRAMDLREAGVTEPFPPAVSSNPLMAPMTRAVGSGLGGTPVAQGAARNVEQVQGALNRTLGAPLEGREAGDLGADIRGRLRRAITERSIPSNEIKGAEWDRLGDITGMTPPESYNPPPPKVRPVEPAPHQTITPEMVLDEYRQSVRPVEAKPVYPNENDFPLKLTKEGDARLEAMRNEAVMLRQRLDQEFGPNRDAAIRSYYSEPLFKAPEFASIRPLFDEAISGRPGWSDAKLRIARNFDPPSNPNAPVGATPNTDRLLSVYKNLRDTDAQLRQANDRLRALSDTEIDRAAIDVRSAAQRAREQEITSARKQAEIEAERRAADETEAARERYVAQFKDSAPSVAEARTQQNMRIAQDEARKETARLQSEAEAQHQQRLSELRSRPEQPFQPGRTRESYATELDAGYEAVRRTVPGLRYNPIEGRGLVTLLDQIAREARRNKELPGYKNGQVFDASGRLDKDLANHLRGQFGNRVVAAIEAHAEAKARGHATTDWWGAHELRTLARREAEQDSMHAARTGERHTVSSAALARLQGALTQDLHGFLRRQGPDGQRASERLNTVDSAYRNDLREIREPLSKIFGEKVGDVEAMDRLVKAAEKGDTRMLGALMRVMREKDDPLRGTSAILFHMTNGGRDIGRFMDAWREMPAPSRDILFSGEQGRALERSLRNYARAIDRLEPFLGTAKKTAGLSPASPTHIVTLAGAIMHWPTVVALVGGNALVARWLSSPRYLNWLTHLPDAARGGFDTQAFKSHLARLGALATDDRQNGVAITQAFKEMLGISKGKD